MSTHMSTHMSTRMPIHITHRHVYIRVDTHACGHVYTHAYAHVYPPIPFIRALYDYETDDSNQLSFAAGDIIDVRPAKKKLICRYK